MATVRAEDITKTEVIEIDGRQSRFAVRFYALNEIHALCSTFAFREDAEKAAERIKKQGTR